MTSTHTRRVPRSEWVPDAYKLNVEGNGDGTGPWSLSRIAAARGMTKAGVSLAFAAVLGEVYTKRPRQGWLPWELPRHHWETTTARRCVLLARRETGDTLSEEEHSRLDLFLATITPGYVVAFDPKENYGRGAFFRRPRIDGEKIVYGVLAVDPGGFDDEDD